MLDLFAIQSIIYKNIYFSLLFFSFNQMTLSPQDFSLQFHPALSTDTAEYICLVNDRHSPEAIIDLLVQGKKFVLHWILCISSIVSTFKLNYSMNFMDINTIKILRTFYLLLIEFPEWF